MKSRFRSAFFHVCLFAMTVIMMTACAKKAASAKGGSTDAASSGPVAVTAAQMVGNWKGGCYLGDPSGSILDVVVIAPGNKFSWRASVALGNTTCASPDYDVDVNGTFVLNGLSSVVSVATNIALTTANGAYTLHTAALVAQANAANAGAGMCGINNWAINVRREVTLDCVSDAPAATYTDIVNLTGSTLMFGNADGTALDPSYAYQRQ